MAEKKRRFELENAPEYQRAMDHLERVQQNATPEESETLARLRGVLDAGDTAGYWQHVAPITENRRARVLERWNGQIAKQASVVEESKALAAEVEAVSALANEAAPVESGAPTDTND